MNGIEYMAAMLSKETEKPAPLPSVPKPIPLARRLREFMGSREILEEEILAAFPNDGHERIYESLRHFATRKRVVTWTVKAKPR